MVAVATLTAPPLYITWTLSRTHWNGGRWKISVCINYVARMSVNQPNWIGNNENMDTLGTLGGSRARLSTTQGSVITIYQGQWETDIGVWIMIY